MKLIELAAAFVVTTVSAVAMAQQPMRLYASDWDTNSVYEFDVGTGTLLRAIVPQEADGALAMAGMAIGADGAIYLTDFFTDAVRRYDRRTGALLNTFIPQNHGGLDNSTDLTFGPDGQLYAANGDAGGVLKFDSGSGAFVSEFISPLSVLATRFMLFHNGFVYVTDHFAQSVKKFNASTGVFVSEFACCAAEGRGLTLSPTGELLVASWESRTIERFNIDTGEHLGTLVQDIRANGLMIGPDGYLYAGEAIRHRIERFDVNTGARNLILGDGILLDPWQFAFAPAIPCPSDFNSDGVGDMFDYLDFVAAFSNSEPVADFNADTVVDLFDYLDFVEVFATGC